MSDLRTAIILDLTGNLHGQSRRFGRDLEQMGSRGSRAIHGLNRGLSMMGRGLDRLGNRYTGFLFGAGGAGAIRMVGNLEQRFTRLGIQANKSAADMARLKGEIFGVAQAADIRIDPGQITAAIEEIVEKTGDLDFARANLRNLAAAIQATGAQGGAIGGIAAEFQKMGLTRPDDVLKALDILDVQGKKGAFTLQNLAALGPRVVTAYTAMGRTGIPAIREMGAALQVIRQGTGSSEMAATAFEALMRTLGDAEKVKLLRRGGIKVFDPEALKKGQQVLRPINELMVEITERAKGRKTILSNIFDAEAIRAFNAAASEFQRTGSVSSLDQFYNVQADGSTVMADSARAAKDFNASLQLLNAAFRQFADSELNQPIKELAGYINSLEPGSVQRWMQVGKWIGIIGGGAILGRKLYSGGRGLLQMFGKGAAGSAIPGMGGMNGVVPVYVVNKHMSLLNNGSGFGIGTAAGGASTTAAAGGTGALWATGAALAAPAGAAAIATISRVVGKAIADNQIKMSSTARLKDMLSRQMVMGAGPDSYSYRQIQAELDRRSAANKTSIEMKLTLDHQNQLKVSHLKSDNPNFEIDTGRTMVGPR